MPIRVATLLLLPLLITCFRPGKATHPIFEESYETIAGTALPLKRYENRILFLFFWVGECAECSSAFIKATDLAKRFPEKSAILGVDTDTEVEDRDRLLDEAKRMGITPPSLLDPDFQLVQSLKVDTVPALIILYPTKTGYGVISHYSFHKEELEWAEKEIRKDMGREKDEEGKEKKW